MATYTFTPSSTYALNTHEVSFANDRIKVKLTSSGQTVYDENYSNGIAFRCDGNDFQIGSLSASQVFIKQVDTGSRKAGLWLVENSGANRFIGSDDTDDSSIYNIYNLNQCPVVIAKNGSYTDIKCPCESESGPCENKCYQYGQ
jgi:hypothetical protein